jgi:hypothetical protein
VILKWPRPWNRFVLLIFRQFSSHFLWKCFRQVFVGFKICFANLAKEYISFFATMYVCSPMANWRTITGSQSNVSRQEVCEEEDLEVDLDLADTTWGRYEKIYIIIFLPTPISKTLHAIQSYKVVSVRPHI